MEVFIRRLYVCIEKKLGSINDYKEFNINIYLVYHILSFKLFKFATRKIRRVFLIRLSKLD